MTKALRVLVCATIVIAAGLAVTLATRIAFAGANLQIVRGSGEFQSLESSITVTKPEALTLQWTTDQAGATGGTWQVTKVGSGVVASGEAQAPTPGHFIRFTLVANAFLLPSPPASQVKFNITITPHNAAKQPLGAASAPVTVSQVPEGNQPPVVFGDNAVFPKVELVSYVEKIGVVPLTQLHFAGADVTILVKNGGTPATDPMWLSVKDNSVLMRQNTPLSIPSMKPGASQTFTVHLDAILPPPKSQLPEEEQYGTWNQWYRDRCGTDLYTVMDWRGPQAQTPMGAHSQTVLASNGPVCDGNQCVKPCQFAKNLHKELDGYVVGYSFFVGTTPKSFEAGGYARTSADGSSNFTAKTKITVASVSKLVTAIAAERILAKNSVKVTDTIEKYLPSDWKVSNYVKNLTFAQLLGQRSGIKDYGNVANDYATLKQFYEQSVSNSSSTACDPKDSNGNLVSVALGQGFVPTNMGWCYSNFNFSIMRILLPKVAGFPEDSNQSTRPQTLANQYTKLVQQNVFDLVGQKDVECKPPAGTNYAFAYKNPGGGKGYDWGDVSLTCGAAGWYMSAEDMGRVLLSVTNKDGKIFTENATTQMLDDLRKRGLGLDSVSDTEIEKNGGWTANCDSNKICATISTSAAIFGPVSGPRMVGVLFLNSPISGGPSNGSGAKAVLEKAYNSALYTK
jgi:CubicO group peptidase (beta-lactamase class C family)